MPEQDVSLPSEIVGTDPPKEDTKSKKRNLEKFLQDNSPVSPSLPTNKDVTAQQQPCRRPVFIEAFAGTANLSRHMFEAGFDVVAIDFKSKHVPKFSCVDIDLSSSSGQQLFWDIVRTTKPSAIHCGVACGTASRARERDIPRHLLQAGAPRPIPLRDADFPLGLPNLSPANQRRVQQANVLYAFTFEVMLYCHSSDIVFTVENPWRSWFWAVITWLAREHSPEACRVVNSLVTTVFDNCMHGGTRPKRSRVDSTTTALQSLAVLCDDSHTHEPFKLQFDNHWKFDTAAEGAYPDLLCARWASALTAIHSEPLQPRYLMNPRAASIASGMRQTSKTKQIIPEFFQVFDCDVSTTTLSPLAKVLGPSTKGDPTKGLSKVGVFHSVEQFLEKSLTAQHPFDTANPVPDVIKLAIFKTYTMGPAEISDHRTKVIKDMLSIKNSLAQEEADLHRRLSPHIARVVRGKNILLFKKLLEDNCYDDMEVVTFLTHGVDLTGSHTLPVYADSRIVPATSTRGQLLRESTWRRKALVSQVPTEDEFHKLEEQTLKEVELGFLEGPMDESEVSRCLQTPDWLLNPRFLLLQGPSQKPRVIDDCRRSGLNTAFTSLERLSLQDFDFVVATCKLLRSCRSGNQIAFTLQDGQEIKGPVHASSVNDVWLARALDLSKAYKQLAVSDESRPLSTVGYLNPSGAWSCFTSSSLPFGATGSVYGFLRISRALWFLVNKLLLIPSCFYFDDFPHFSLTRSSKGVKLAFETFLDCLGWQYAGGDKNLPFDRSFNILGGRINLEHLNQGHLTVENKPGRIQHVTDLVKQFDEDPTKQSLSVLRGHVNFASGFCLGRFLLPTMALLSGLVNNNSTHRAAISAACNRLTDLLQRSKPRPIACIHEGDPIIVFTDAAFENTRATMGALVCDPSGGSPFVYDGVVPSNIVTKWMDAGSKQIIAQAELFTLVVLRDSLKRILHNRKAIFFIDNEAARFCIIKALSNVSSMQVLASHFHELDVEWQCYHWVERVPSLSNPADLPTRGKLHELIQMVNGSYGGPLVATDDLLDRILTTKENPMTFDDPSEQLYLTTHGLDVHCL